MAPVHERLYAKGKEKLRNVAAAQNNNDQNENYENIRD